MSRLDAIRARNRALGLTSHQIMLQAKATGDPLLAAEADAQAVRERLQRGPHRSPALEADDTAPQAANVLQAAFPRGMSTHSGSAWVTR